MKAFLFVLFILSGTVLQTSCKCAKPGSSVTQDKKIADVIVDGEFVEPSKNDPVTITKLSIEGNILFIDVEYSGGCKDHDFRLFYNNIYMKSMPPKATLFLVHNANEDACREMISKTLSFNISAIKDPNPKSKEVIVMVKGSDQAVSYRY
jgi:hypothetical protein